MVADATLRDGRPMGEGKHVRFTVESRGARARAVAFGDGRRLPVDDGAPAEATFTLEVNEWNGVSEPRLVLRRRAPRPARRAEPPECAGRTPVAGGAMSSCCSLPDAAHARSRAASIRRRGPLPYEDGDREESEESAMAEVTDAPACRRLPARPAGWTSRPAVDGSPRQPRAGPADLSEPERRLLSDLFAIVSEHAADSAVEIDRARVQDAFVFACEHHAAQRRKSGEDFIVHPVGVARICAGMRLDTETLCAALLHDTVEDTSASIEEVRERFGEEISQRSSTA